MKTGTMFLCWGRKERDKEEWDTKGRETAVAPTPLCHQQTHHQPSRPARCFWACGGRRVLPAPSHRRHSRYEQRRPWCWHSSIPQPRGPAAALPAAAAGGTRACLASAQRDAGDSGACGPSRPSVYAVSTHRRRGTLWIKLTFTMTEVF